VASCTDQEALLDVTCKEERKSCEIICVLGAAITAVMMTANARNKTDVRIFADRSSLIQRAIIIGHLLYARRYPLQTQKDPWSTSKGFAAFFLLEAEPTMANNQGPEPMLIQSVEVEDTHRELRRRRATRRSIHFNCRSFLNSHCLGDTSEPNPLPAIFSCSIFI
jgi:hypothetical protein